MIVGGLRLRLVHDSLFQALRAGLDELGWFDSHRSHRPVRFIAKPQDWDEPVEPNTLALATTGIEADWMELGSPLLQNSVSVQVDLFAEGDSLGMALIGDLKDLLRGRVGTAVPRGSVPLYDYRHATPPVVGRLHILDTSIMRTNPLTQEAWMRHWFTLDCTVADTYLGNAPVLPFPGPDLAPGPDVYPFDPVLAP